VSGVLIAIGLYAIIGAVVARAMGNSDMKQALFAGIAAPAIVVSVLAGAADAPRRGSQTAWLVSSANAQVGTAIMKSESDSGGGKALTFDTSVKGNFSVDEKINVTADIKEGGQPPRTISIGSYTVGTGTTFTVKVPDNATSLKLDGRPIDLNKGTNVYTLKVTPTTTVRGDLLWALGAKRTYEIGDFELKPK
jgi:hypothetical protein